MTNNYINNTLFQSSSRLQHILETDDQNLSKGKDHGEDHPNLDQLDVGRAWQWLADSKETEKFIFSTFFIFKVLLMDKKHLQRGKDKQDSEIDLDNHVQILPGESGHHVCQKDQHCSG